MKKVKIAILGLGTVGQGVWTILDTNKNEIMKRSGCEVEVSKILVRDSSKHRNVEVPSGIITTNPDEILNDDSIDVVVELMGGLEPAREYIGQ
jgi:Homoserine dehydrogenase